MTAIVVRWDVVDGDTLGALVKCSDCPCRPGLGCDGDGVLFRPYRLPGGHFIDLYRDADLLVRVLDRAASGPTDTPPDSGSEGPS